MKTKPCRSCTAVLNAPISLRPRVVHPVDRTPELYDVHLTAICRDCGVRWRRNVDNSHEMVSQ